MRLIAIITILLLAGCKTSECEQLIRCCEAAAEHPGMGGACSMARDVVEPGKCESIIDAIRAMYEQTNQKDQIPAACLEQE